MQSGYGQLFRLDSLGTQVGGAHAKIGGMDPERVLAVGHAENSPNVPSPQGPLGLVRSGSDALGLSLLSPRPSCKQDDIAGLMSGLGSEWGRSPGHESPCGFGRGDTSERTQPPPTVPAHVMSAEERRANSTDSASTAHETGSLRCSATTASHLPGAGRTLLGPIRQSSLDLISGSVLPPEAHGEADRQSIFQDVLEQVGGGDIFCGGMAGARVGWLGPRVRLVARSCA